MKNCKLGYLFVIAFFVSLPAFAYKGENLATKAKIPLDEARAIAVKSYPGTIVDEELKKGRGGLYYIFSIKDDAVSQKVVVDAKSGKILDYKVDGYQGK